MPWDLFAWDAANHHNVGNQSDANQSMNNKTQS